MRLILTGLLLLLAAPLAAQQPDPLRPFVLEAWENNLGLKAQRLSHEKAEAAVDQARGMFLPSVSFDARYSQMNGGLDLGDLVNPAYQALNQLTGTAQFPTNIDGQFPYAQETRVRVAQPLFQPAVLANYRIQKHLRELDGAKLRMAARALAADVQLAYVNYARAERVVEVYSNTRAVVNEAVRVNEKLLANGKITPAALHRAIADRSDIEQQIMQAEQQRNAAARYLNFVLGRAPETPVAPIADSLLVRDAEEPVEALISRALNAREELKQADWGIRVSEQQAALARSSFLPAVSLAFDYGVQGNEYRFDRNSDVAVASLVFSWNVFNGGQDQARRQQALLDVQRGKVTRAQAEQQIELQVRQSYDALAVSKHAIGAARDRLNAARRAFELVQRRYAEGMAAQLEFIDARSALTAAELNLIITQYGHVANYIELERVAALRNIGEDQ